MFFSNYIMNVIDNLGYFGIFIAVFLEYACLPLPSEILLPFIGILSSYGTFSLISAICISVLAGVTGSTLCYYIGYIGGAPLLNWASSKSSSVKKSMDKLNIFLSKYDKYAVLIARMFPLTRTYVSLGVGALKMKYTTFISYSLAGIVIWNSILISLGYFLGENTHLIESILKNYTSLAFLILIITIIIFGFIYLRKRKVNN